MTQNCGELKRMNGGDTLIVCFGGLALKMGMIPPFEFLNFLTKTYNGIHDSVFYVDYKTHVNRKTRYHEGIVGISHDVESTVTHINNIITKGNYKHVLFMGVSAGGYAAILFGSLCKANKVIAFIPRTVCDDIHAPAIDKKYSDLRNFINNTTQYTLYADLSVKDIYDSHHVSQCEYLQHFSNVNIIKRAFVDLPKMKNNGELKLIIDDGLQ